MPSINRIRVNNVKYNFGTQFYDDFTMRMHGKNTLYDLANGGGKSVLMLLLLQNMIPNCTLDEKQPIEKLFRTGNGNTTIHSLVEWKLDAGDSKDGYRYMTTGFCARKAKEADEGAEKKNDVASIEYFNYCIFYREYNKNDIVNIPLVENGERITYQGLRTYLKELEHKDMGLMVRIFDRKGEYQRFISTYGIHESQWEIIRGINKTEGHVRTYFENNYKTTRKVVEDLLIEEIIEKAFLVKTEREEKGDDSMARMLMDIKEQLTILAKKKKDIAAYDHQMELISVLKDKVASFMDLYREQNELSSVLANIYVTGEQFSRNDEKHMEALAAKRDDKRHIKDAQRKKLECLKVSRDKKQLEELKNELEEILSKSIEIEKRKKTLNADYQEKESINDYLLYIADREKYYQYDAIVKSAMSSSSFDEEKLYQYAYNIKMRTDVSIADTEKQIKVLEDKVRQYELEQEYNEKLLSEAQTALAVAVNARQQAISEIEAFNEILAGLQLSMSSVSFTAPEEQLFECKEEQKKLLQQIDEEKSVEADLEAKIYDTKMELMDLTAKHSEINKLIEEISQKEKELNDAKAKLDNIKVVYHNDDIERLPKVISQRITDTDLDIAALHKNITLSQKNIQRLKEGRLIEPSESVKKVINYIETRHGVTAMFGMDYLSALPEKNREHLLEINPEIPYAILISEYEVIKDDPNIMSVDIQNVPVSIYDIKTINEKALIYSENAFTICASTQYLTDENTKNKLILAEEEKLKDYKTQLEVKHEMIEAYREDLGFVLRVSDREFTAASEKLKNAKLEEMELEEALRVSKDKLSNYEGNLSESKIRLADFEVRQKELIIDIEKLSMTLNITEVIEKHEESAAVAKSEIERLENVVLELSNKNDDGDRQYVSDKASLALLEEKKRQVKEDWNNYKAYYNEGKEYGVLTLTDDELKAKLNAMVSENKENAESLKDKKLLMDTLSESMERILKNIEKRGISKDVLVQYERENKLYPSDEEVLSMCKKSLADTEQQLKELLRKQKDKESVINRLEGSISYAISNIEAAFGPYEDIDASVSEIMSALENGEELLRKLEAEVKACEEEYKSYVKQQGYMVELYKDVKRIVATDEIDLSNAVVLGEDKDKLREIFEDTLIRYDRSNKKLDKAKNELLKFKGNTATALDRMEIYELAATIRNDVVIPDDYNMAKELMDNLTSIVEYISLERGRIEQSLTDMKNIKDNFEEQCLQRCLDVKTELDKLPKLSRIISGDEAIQMVGLTVPYVKEEFMRQRMSDYIDRVVAQADDYDNDKERIKFIRNSLTLKKMFGVIVTDMNAIKLSLYKRERIKEQSRYLKYEEAVGSTGQSQGIYIQFLVSIINYISGMYHTGNEDVRTKTIFIDNPFGAAKDVYIWEPIFELLKANNVQLIVPARGATPAITGRFDVNYILGQQMSGGKQLTVVIDYTSQVDQDELEYHDLEYEQVSFDFI